MIPSWIAYFFAVNSDASKSRLPAADGVAVDVTVSGLLRK